MVESYNSRERVLRLFAREEIDYIPAFSGMGNVTTHGLEKYGYKFAEIHTDARKMANMAASTNQLFGFESAVVPFDFGVEAEVLGCEINYYPHLVDGVVYPTIRLPLSEKVEDLDIQLPADLASAGRVPVITEALSLLKKEMGNQLAIGAYILGPYTIVAQVVDIGELAKACFKKPDMVSKLLEKAVDLIISLAKLYREAGADYINIREMGAGPDILSPRIFQSLIRPHLERTFATLESPKVLHICGDSNSIVDQMGVCGADAISVEEKNNVAETRKKLGPDALVFGNIAGHMVLCVAKPDVVDKMVKEAISNGVNAIWPGDDIWPEAPKENMEALMAAVRKYGKLESC